MSKEEKQWKAIQEMEEVVKQVIQNQNFLTQLIMTLGESVGKKFEHKEEIIEEGKKRISGNWVSKSGIIKP